eukprot:XP_016653693.1 CIR protein [Plasmodium chabaudi chabaudi]
MCSLYCEFINTIDVLLDVKWDGSKISFKYNSSLDNYCSMMGDEKQEDCNNYEEMISSAFLTLLHHFKSVNAGDENLEDDKLAQYALLWLCYEINKNKNNEISNLNDFHNKYIKNIEKYIMKIPNLGAYNSYKGIIDKQQNSMPIGVKEMFKLYEALKILCDMYTECDKKKQNYINCLQDANDFAKHFEELNQDSSITGNNSYREILSSLLTNYNNFKSDCNKKCSKCSDIPTLTNIKAPQSFEHASSSSSIASTLIPVLLAFTIPFFLGVAYKYSLFGFDKRLQRQYIREKVKKIKKKMTNYV